MTKIFCKVLISSLNLIVNNSSLSSNNSNNKSNSNYSKKKNINILISKLFFKRQSF